MICSSVNLDFCMVLFSPSGGLQNRQLRPIPIRPDIGSDVNREIRNSSSQDPFFIPHFCLAMVSVQAKEGLLDQIFRSS